MKRVFGGIILLLAAAIFVLGLVNGVQLHSPWWQKLVAILIFTAIAYGLAALGRRLWRRGSTDS